MEDRAQSRAWPPAAARRGEGGRLRLQTLLPKKKLAAKEPLTALPLGGVGTQSRGLAGVFRRLLLSGLFFLFSLRAATHRAHQRGVPPYWLRRWPSSPCRGGQGVGVPRGVS